MRSSTRPAYPPGTRRNAVTAEALQSVAQRVLIEGRRVVGWSLPKPGAAAAAAADGPGEDDVDDDDDVDGEDEE